MTWMLRVRREYARALCLLFHLSPLATPATPRFFYCAAVGAVGGVGRWNGVGWGEPFLSGRADPVHTVNGVKMVMAPHEPPTSSAVLPTRAEREGRLGLLIRPLK